MSKRTEPSSINGKEISNFYVEGMDVSGGRYNQIKQ